MYGREKRVLLRHYLEQGLTKAELAKKLGLHRRTIYHWIETGQLDRELDDKLVRYTPRPAIFDTERIDQFARKSIKACFGPEYAVARPSQSAASS